VAKSLPSNFLQRVVSALIVAVPAIASIQFGAPAFNVFIAALAVLMAWEWACLCQGKLNFGGIMLAIFAGSIALLPLFNIPFEDILTALPLCCLLLFLTARRNEGRLLFCVGSLYILIPVCAFIFLRSDVTNGLEYVYWLAFVVVATDTGAYGFGLTIGGPKLAPRISPKKTWAGLFGGMFCAGLTGLLFAFVFDWNEALIVALISSSLAVIAQMGDLFESHVKRTFDVKDSSNIIPGHGGVLDRMDGMLSAGAAFAGLILATDGQILAWF